ncbi:MAG: amino acid racemase [Proteobacteria bacterium]|nr:amino acid racemase [Pseudomonadota bacterium]
MRTIGLIGGLSWESTVPYYRVINETVREARGGLSSARIILSSLDFAEIAALQHANDWAGCQRVLCDAARALRAAGAECVAICTNTMHKLADEVEAAAGLPLLHIADATARAIQAAGLSQVGLLGTRFTMESDFYRDRLQTRHGIDTLIPAAEARDTVHRIIYDELCQGVVCPESRTAARDITAALAAQGAQGIVLGCTELPMLLHAHDSVVPVFDTGVIHARHIARWALGEA